MASLQQKRPSISNWFSSLRRQPKHKKSPTLHGADNKQFQRSCIDLTSSSTFYVSSLPGGGDVGGGGGGGKAGPIFLPKAPATDNLPDEDDRRGLVSGKRVSQLCSRCCCHMLPKSRANTPPPPPPPSALEEQPPKTPLTPTHFTNWACDSPATPPTPPTPPTSTLSSQTVITTDVSRNVKTSCRPCREDNNALIVNKQTEFKRTMTTTTTRTLIISRPMQLILNERGEVIMRRPVCFEKAVAQRSSSLDCVLDDDNTERELEIASDSSSPRPPLSADAMAMEGGGEFRYIDDSTSQSENERNSQNNGTRMSASNNQQQQQQQPNNNNNRLCEICKNVVELNRNNAEQSAVVMRSKQIKDELCEVVSEMEALDVPEDCKHSNKDKQMSIGRKKFNMDPKKGIEYLVENRLLRHDPQDVAHFLYKGEGLNKTAIGDYLGEKNDFNEDVLKAFVALHDFTNLILVQALRQFLWSFRLPGEAQKIDRMMECFAQRYCQLNPDIFTNTDTCYVLSFAIIMLNTSLHNPSVKDKPTVEQFISMNRGINNGGDLPRGLLESLYESIRTEPFKIPQDDGNDLMHTFFNPDKEGWLWKQGGRYKSWKRRWFILNDNCLYYFEYTTDKEPRGIIPLENISVREIHDRSKPHCFELFATGGADIIKACKTDSEGKVVEGKHTVYRMSAATEEDQQEWIKRLTQSISHNPFYDILVQRKKKALSKS